MQPGSLLAAPGPLRRGRGPRHPQPPPPAVTCCATLTPRPLSSLLPPTTLSPFTVYDSRGGGGREEAATALRRPTAWRAALMGPRRGRHDAVLKTFRPSLRSQRGGGALLREAGVFRKGLRLVLHGCRRLPWCCTETLTRPPNGVSKVRWPGICVPLLQTGHV